MIRLSLLLGALLVSGCYMSHERRTGDRPDGGSVCASGFCGAGETCCELCDGEAICVGSREPCPDVFCPPETCTSTFECGADEYCASAAGACFSEGTCEPRPTGCFSDCPTVCGCDGTTYCNVCEAAQAGVSVLHSGGCEMPPPPCDCGFGQYCDFGPECFDNPFPVCTPQPDICTDEEAPVCGCDGFTYPNACYAQSAGVSIRFFGACDVDEDVEETCDVLCDWGDEECGGTVDECEDLCAAVLEGCTSEDLARARACTTIGDCMLGTACLEDIPCIPIVTM